MQWCSSIGDALNLRVTFTDDLGALYTRIRVIDFVAYDPAGGSSFYDIVKEGILFFPMCEVHWITSLLFSGCVTDQGFNLNAAIQSTLAFPPAVVSFEAFRFAKNPRVAFNLTVRVCQAGSPLDCTFTVKTNALL